MNFSSVRDLKFKTSEVLRRTTKGEPVIITSHGRPTAMLVPAAEQDLEDLLLAYSPSLRRKIQKGLEDIEKGRLVSLEAHLARRAKTNKGK